MYQCCALCFIVRDVLLCINYLLYHYDSIHSLVMTYLVNAKIVSIHQPRLVADSRTFSQFSHSRMLSQGVQESRNLACSRIVLFVFFGGVLPYLVRLVCAACLLLSISLRMLASLRTYQRIGLGLRMHAVSSWWREKGASLKYAMQKFFPNVGPQLGWKTTFETTTQPSTRQFSRVLPAWRHFSQAAKMPFKRRRSFWLLQRTHSLIKFWIQRHSSMVLSFFLHFHSYAQVSIRQQHSTKFFAMLYFFWRCERWIKCTLWFSLS